MTNDKKKIWQRNLISGLAFVLAYIVQLINVNVENEFDVISVTKILLIAFLFGILVYLVITGIYWIIRQFQGNEAPDSSVMAIDAAISPIELCNLCGELTVELHNSIVDSLQLQEFDSDLVDDMSEEITKSWVSPCLAFSYGLVSISMLNRDADFLHSDLNKRLQVYVMKQMAASTEKSIVTYGVGEASNQELVDEVTEDVKAVIRGVTDYFKQDKNGEELPFTSLIYFLSGKNTFKVDSSTSSN